MDSQPKRPIEAMLEASAKARREAFGPEPAMPNPMRARLHDEIGRGQSTEPEPRSSWLHMFWPRLAVAAAMATLLVIGPLMWWRGSNREAMQVAGPDAGNKSVMNENAASADETFSEAKSVSAVSSPNVNVAQDKPARLELQQTPAIAATDIAKDSQSLADAAPAAASAPAAPAPPAVTKGFITKEEAPDSETRGAPGSAASAQASMAEKARADEARQIASAQTNQAAGGSAVAAAPTYHFSQQPVGQPFQNTVQRRQVANVLNNFEVQQQGNEIRVVDSDGSTYTGQLEPVKRSTERAAKRNYAAGTEETTPEANATRFRATGFNVSLRKSLVFEGNLSQSPPQAAKSKSPNDSTKAEANVEPSRIVGTARVPGEPPVEVDARPVPVEKFER